jgi:hypothetical protein
MGTEEDVRRIALGLPETSERVYNRLPGFQVRRQLFIRIHEIAEALMVSCAGVQERNELLVAEPDKFFITPHYDGYPAVLVRLGEVDGEELTELITESWRLNAPKRLLAAFDNEHPPRPVP